MRQKITFLRIMLLAALSICNIAAFGQLTESFESGLPSSYSTTTSYSLTSGTWTGASNAILAGTTGVHSGSKSCQIRSQTGAFITTPLITTGVGTVTFWAQGSAASNGVQVRVSTDGGSTFTQVGSTINPSQSATQQYTVTVNETGNSIKIQFYRTAGTIYIDDVSITSYSTCTDPALAFTETPPTTKALNDAPFSAAAASALSNGAITYSSSNPSVATIASDGMVTIAGGGTTTITATQTADATYCEGMASYTLTVTCTTNTLAFANATETKPFSDGTFTNVATSLSPASITYASSNTAVATVNSSGVVTFASIGSTTITATQAPDLTNGYCGATASYTLNITQTPAATPYSEDFESAAPIFELLNGSQTNKWAIGSATGNPGKSLYISNNNGTSNAYTTENATSTVWAYRTVTVSTAGDYTVSFDWKANGERYSSNPVDYLVAFLAPIGTLPTAGSQVVNGTTVTYSATSTPTGWTRLGGNVLYLSSSWSRVSDDLTLPAGTYNLIFLWRNDISDGAQPPAAIDNIEIVRKATIDVDPTSLTGFAYSTIPGGPSTSQRIEVYGYNLSTDITVTPPAGYELATSATGNYYDSAITLTKDASNAVAEEVYVRLKAGLSAATYAGNISIATTGATSKTVAVTGEVTETVPVGTAATGVETSGFTANWNAVTGATDYTLNVYKKIEGIPTTVTEGFDNGSVPATWSTTVSDFYNTTASSGASPNSLKMANNGEYVTTTTLPSSATGLSFWMKGNGTNNA